ncbi:MAG: sterol desaturase family protein, partial [Chitinophagaceae bacterium]
MTLIYGNIILLLCVIIEIVYIHYFQKESIDLTDITTNINSGHILLFIFRSLGLAVYFYVWEKYSLGFTTVLPNWLTWLLCIIAWDFCYYWSHRLHHQLTVLWFVHQVHHQGEHFNLSLGLRNSWYSTITSLPFFLALALIGIPVEIFTTISAFHYFIQFLNHCHIKIKIPSLYKLFISPSDHRVHHGKNDPYRNKNFGGTFVIWDKLFGTFQSEKKNIPIELGVLNTVKSANILLINNPYNAVKNLASGKIKIQEQKHKTPLYIILCGCLILFGLLCCYLYVENFVSDTEKILLFTLIFLGTIVNGGLSDG